MKDNDRLRTLLRQALSPTGDDNNPAHDLWPELQRRIAESKSTAAAKGIPWFDLALAGGVAIVAVAFPAAIPVLLYYL